MTDFFIFYLFLHFCFVRRRNSKCSKFCSVQLAVGGAFTLWLWFWISVAYWWLNWLLSSSIKQCRLPLPNAIEFVFRTPNAVVVDGDVDLWIARAAVVVSNSSKTSFVVNKNSLFITSYVCCIKWSKSIFVNPAVWIGGNVVIMTCPLLNCRWLSSKNERYELNTTGRMGSCASMATWNAPFLNECIWPVLRRVPSGKIHILIFLFLMLVAESVNFLRDASDCIRLMKIKPHSHAAKPNGQAKKSSRFATTVHLFITGHMSNIPEGKNEWKINQPNHWEGETSDIDIIEIFLVTYPKCPVNFDD